MLWFVLGLCLVSFWFTFGLLLVYVRFYLGYGNGGVEKATYPHGRAASEFINI
jgi:hypothetical protein|nr:MAG TPA: Photosynthetic reaction center cytochrome c photosynthesis, Light-harvesting complex, PHOTOSYNTHESIS [Caudoviricetes sp.]